MKRRICLMAVENAIVQSVAARLPDGVIATGIMPVFDRAVTILRLEGPALPDWCEEPPFGQQYAWAYGLIGTNGAMAFTPASPFAPTLPSTGITYEQMMQRLYGPETRN